MRIRRSGERRWRVARPAGLLGVVFVLVAGCGAGDERTPAADPSDGESPSVEPASEPTLEPTWWQPAPGEAANWDWQLEEPYDISQQRDMYDLDLFEVAPPGSQLVYPDGTVIDLEPGPLAGAVDLLHERDLGTIVVCYVDTGAYEHYRPDAHLFPGYQADLDDVPDRPAAPAVGSVLGWSTGWDEERWLDIRPGSRESWTPLMWARFDLARELGCDGVEPDQNNPVGNDPGFPITVADQESWYRELAAQAHARGLSVGLKNGHDQPGSTAALVEHFDWALPEECVEFDECDELLPFVEQGKAVFAVDYAGAVDEATACREHADRGFDGMVKGEPPTAAHRMQCGH